MAQKTKKITPPSPKFPVNPPPILTISGLEHVLFFEFLKELAFCAQTFIGHQSRPFALGRLWHAIEF